MSDTRNPFWENKRLEEMNSKEWESLCDRCGRCCLHKIEDEDTGEIFYTSVVCRLFDMKRCTCTVYAERNRLVPTCLIVTPENAGQLKWMPKTCAYRMLAEGRPLEWWHPLVSGTYQTVLEAGISVRDRVISEDFVHPDDIADYVIEDDESL